MGRRVSDSNSTRVTVPPSTTIEKGQWVAYDGLIGMALMSLVTTDASGSLIIDLNPGEYETNQIDTSKAFARGESVYWDDVNLRITTDAGHNRRIGVVTVAKDAQNVIWFRFDLAYEEVQPFAWTRVIGSADIVANSGYITDSTSRVDLALPATIPIDTLIEVCGYGTGGWKITQRAGQKIIFGDKVTTTGSGGYLQSADYRDSLKLLCVEANTTFKVLHSVGNITVA